ncbi:apolipoprotein N-acyltransferase [Limoniibacter endophyticus]|uniref:Apolipoprotein N-acyltransferase n=1 Tax=Limoniibacter endophyticus TaxID=1565040 RepID=A0A8J3GHX8_9HYPH|nr:apolipoprotein N-acyltransferase [Limoniibacter endophyticus]GHC74654.1 apolipoprotein N-acyltransferase [Limoniibacter endophyticus]
MERFSAKIVMLHGYRRAGLALIAGAFLALAQAPFDFFFAGFISIPLLVWLLDGAAADRKGRFLSSIRPAFSVGWFFGFGYFLAGLWWVATALLVDAEQFAWAIPLAITVLPAGLALFYALATASARIFWSDGLGRVFALAASFGIFEWLRGTILTGFPWNPVGFAGMPTPILMQSVHAVGSASMNILVVLLFAVPALLSTRRHLMPGAAGGFLLLAMHLGYGYWHMQQPVDDADKKPLNVRVVQPAIDQSEKWDGAVRDRIFSTLLDLSRQPNTESRAPSELIVWPETSIPFLLTDRPDALVQIADMLKAGQMLIAGAVREEQDPSVANGVVYYNSMIAIDDAGVIADAVDKVHLVPFGEYMPFEEQLARWGITKIVPLPASFRPGTQSSLSILDGIIASGFICYEIIFPGEVGRSADGAGLIINITNDAWFGTTPGPYQHFRQAQIRAVETGLSVIRAANSGISGLIDPRGHVVGALSLNSKGFVDVTAMTRPGHKIPAAQHNLIFLSLLITLGLFSFGLSGVYRRKISLNIRHSN